MSAYEIEKIFYRLDLDAALLEALKTKPDEAIKDFNLTPEERRAFLEGDIGAMYRMGVHTFLLASTVRHQLLGITREVYERRLFGRDEAPKA